MLRTVILDNKIAEMGAPAWAVYCAIKAYAHMQTGVAWPNQATIAKHVGMSVDTVARATERLIEMGMVRRELVGRHNTYRLVEQLPLEREGERVGHAEQDYAPREFQTFIEQLKEYAKSGQMPPGATINITFNLTTIRQGAHSTVNQQVVVADRTGPDVGPDAGPKTKTLRRIK